MNDIVIPKKCSLCGLEKKASLGPLVTNQGMVVHILCMVYSNGVWERPSILAPMFLKTADGSTICNSKYRPETMRFNEVKMRSKPCHSCFQEHASLHCSRTDCNNSYHIPCAISSKRTSYIFHAKMVYYPDEELTDAAIVGVVRSGRFFVCGQHPQWDHVPLWISLRKHITEDPDLFNDISIDVDCLPQHIQIAVSKICQLLVFNPEANIDACENIVVFLILMSFYFLQGEKFTCGG